MLFLLDLDIWPTIDLYFSNVYDLVDNNWSLVFINTGVRDTHKDAVLGIKFLSRNTDYTGVFAK